MRKICAKASGHDASYSFTLSESCTFSSMMSSRFFVEKIWLQPFFYVYLAVFKCL